MRDNRLPGVLAREKFKREASPITVRYEARPWCHNRGHWLVGTDLKSAAAVRNMTKGVTRAG